MIIKTLVENTSISKDFNYEHGLSLYIELNNKRILFDVGTTELFLENAKKLNVEIENIDYLIISHGHYDHGGGLSKFLEINKKAKVFINENAFKKYYALRANNNLEYIGLEKDLENNKQFCLVSDYFQIDDNLQLFSNVLKKESMPYANKNLLMEEDGKIIDDKFLHEQNLIIEDNNKLFLITGCAHNGIVNIIEHFHSIKNKMPDYILGGFHLSSKTYGNEPDKNIKKIGEYLKYIGAKSYTCHCTGIEPYNILKNIVGDNIDYLSTGTIIEI